MKVYELIRELTRFPPDAEITIVKVGARKRQRVLSLSDRDWTGRQGQVTGKRIQIVTMFVCDPVFYLPEFFDDLISHFEIPP